MLSRWHSQHLSPPHFSDCAGSPPKSNNPNFQTQLTKPETSEAPTSDSASSASSASESPTCQEGFGLIFFWGGGLEEKHLASTS